MSDETRNGAMSRRSLLGGVGLALAAGAVARAQEAPGPGDPPDSDPDFGGPEQLDAPPPMEPAPSTVDWNWVRGQWALDWSWVNLSAMLFASHPRIVRNAIARHRDGLDANPVTYLEANNRPLQNAARRAAGLYFGANPDAIALTESTTSGIGLVYNGLLVGYGEEIVTTTHDYYVTHESLRLAARRSGATVKKISLFDQAATANKAQIVGRLMGAITERTRVLALTWVHSSTVLLIVDGVHGFGVEDITFDQLGADVLAAGCHKWLFGPRGTGVVYFRPESLARFEPTIPSFLAPNAYGAWLGNYDPGATTGARMTPGGFKAFEHVWALSEAFAFHGMVGKAAIAARTRSLASRLKLALRQMPHVVLRTPMDPSLSAGIVSFDLPGLSADGVVRRMRSSKVIGSAAPYSTRHVRLTPSFRNTEADVDFAAQIIANIRK
jgi:selenocysteine lyase/cysteine desulfurase